MSPEPMPADLAGACVLLYSGNYGIAHEVETFVEGYRLHHRDGSGRVQAVAQCHRGRSGGGRRRA